MTSGLKTIRLLVLDGEQRSALALVRSLGRKGVDILVGSTTNTSLAGCSRYCRKQVRYSDPFQNPIRFYEDLIAIIAKEQVSWLMPMTDLSMSLVLAKRSTFEKMVVIPCESREKYLCASDKIKLAKMARDIGVPVPTSKVVTEKQEVLSNLAAIQYPVVLKPRASILHREHKIIKTSVHIADNEEMLLHLLDNDIAFSQPFMLQEKIAGYGTGIFALCRQGETLAIFSHRRLREKPPWGGVSVLCESAIPDPVAKDHAQKLLSALGWNGVAMVEFKYDPKRHVYYLMEINARFWGSLQLAIDAGVDFPYLLCQIYRDRFNPAEINYQYARMRWLLGDIDSLYLALKYPQRLKPLTWPKALYHFLTEFKRGSRFQILRKDDLRPFWHEMILYLKEVMPK